MIKAPDNVSFGIAGWSYPDWAGIVYPAHVKDQLQFAAGYVDVIEINSTFYRPPSAKTVESWIRRTSDHHGFYFTAKLHQDITHRGILEPDMVRKFHDGFQPMSEAGKLRHLLAQFRYDFDDTPVNREHVNRIRSAFSDLSHITLELRHNSWQSPRALTWLESLGVTVANLDYPLARNSFNLLECRVGEHRYLRLHGRNAAAWFDKHAGRDETYNYSYSSHELKEIAGRAEALAESAESLTIVGNNHFQGKELVNILQLKSLMTGQKVAVPRGLSDRYPELKNIALTDRL